MKIEDLAQQYKEYNELLIYSQAQYKTILSQSKEITELQNKVIELEKLLVNSTPIIQDPNAIATMQSRILGVTDEEAVAIMELAKLKEISLDRPLEMDEAKRYQIYTQTLHMVKNKKKDSEKSKSDGLDDLSLLDILENK